MDTTFLVRTVAGVAATCMAVAGLATAAAAEDPSPATLSLSTLDVLTLPADDGVRDGTSLIITSDTATDVDLEVDLNGDTVATFDSVSVAAGAPTPVTINLADLSALAPGNYDVVATPVVGGDPATAELVIGSGEPTDVALTLSASKLYTYSKASPRSVVATVSATDETGLTVPFAGSVKAVVGGKTSTTAVASTTGNPAKSAAISVTKLALGTGAVTATVHGVSGTNYASDPVALKVLQTAITKLKVSANNTTVFPVKDSYKDTAKITVTPTSGTGAKIAASGSVVITYKGKTVKSWKLTSSNVWSATWDGKNKGKVVAGSYTVTVKLKAAEGATKTVKGTIKVDKGKLKTTTKTITYKAHSILKSFLTFDEYEESYCAYNNYKSGDFGCIGYDAYYDDTISVIGDGSASLPSYVIGAQKYATPTATVTMHTTTLSGAAAWTIDTTRYGDAKVGAIAKGNKTLSSLKLPSGTKKLYVTVGLGEYALWVADTITIKYTYKVMTH